MPNHLSLGIALKVVFAWLATAALACPGAAVAADHAGHSHGPEDHPAGLTLEPGAGPWATDAALREGMGRIRDAVAQALTSSAEGRLTRETAGALARSIEDNVAYLVANCTLTPQADAALHVLLGQLQHGAHVLRTDPASPEGIASIHAALRDYPRHFSHPGWSALPGH
ncbi:MAG: hypothetical protein AB7U81_08480 [Thiohalomonadaceae bacterium]